MSDLDNAVREHLPLAAKIAYNLTRHLKGRLACREEAEADALVGVWKALAGYREGAGEMSIKNYITRRITAEVIDGLRKRNGGRKRHRGRADLNARMLTWGAVALAMSSGDDATACPGFGEALRRWRADEAVRAAREDCEELLASLLPSQRELLTDLYLRGMTMVEAGAKRGRSDSNVLRQVKQIREAVKA